MNFFYNVYTEASSVESLEVYLQDHSDELYDIYASRYNVLSEASDDIDNLTSRALKTGRFC